jgi:pyruvate,orthophosphate dikinase
MNGLPTIIGAIDPPRSRCCARKGRAMPESNSMIGTRGVRLRLVIPGLEKMQIRAVLEGACLAKQQGADPHPEVMVPITMHSSELTRVAPIFDDIVAKTFAKYGATICVKFETMT